MSISNGKTAAVRAKLFLLQLSYKDHKSSTSSFPLHPSHSSGISGVKLKSSRSRMKQGEEMLALGWGIGWLGWQGRWVGGLASLPCWRLPSWCPLWTTLLHAPLHTLSAGPKPKSMQIREHASRRSSSAFKDSWRADYKICICVHMTAEVMRLQILVVKIQIT